MISKTALFVLGTTVLTACGATTATEQTFASLLDSEGSIDAAVDALNASPAVDVTNATGNAKYEGVVLIRDYDQSGLEFMAYGDGLVLVNFDLDTTSGQATNFFEIDVAQSNLTSSDPNDYVTTAISGSLFAPDSADEWNGTLTQVDGDVMEYGMQVYNYQYLGDELGGLLIEADGIANFGTAVDLVGTFEFGGLDENRISVQ